MKHLTRRQFNALMGAGLSVAAGPGFAQIGLTKIVVGFPPGGTVDAMARRLAEKLKGTYAENVIVENKPGAGGRIAVETVKNAAPDGNTVLFSPGSMLVIYPHVYRKLSYDTFKDLQPVSPVALYTCAFAVGPGVPESVKTLAQFIDWAKTAPKASYASPAPGSMPHFLGDVFKRKAGIDLQHVPYRGMAPAVQDLLGGQVPSCMGVLGEFLQHKAAGRVRVLAVSSEKRSRFMPDVPTFTELGYKEVSGTEWYGLLLPASTEATRVNKLAEVIAATVKDSQVADGFAQIGFEATSQTPAAFVQNIRKELEYWGPVVKASGFSSDD
jgi:tripartite-type tricarboxylate transporter receptor subunit TctC